MCSSSSPEMRNMVFAGSAGILPAMSAATSNSPRNNPARMPNKAPVTVLSAFCLSQHYNHSPQIHPIDGQKKSEPGAVATG